MCSQSDAIFQNKDCVGKLVKLIDKTNGYIFGGIEANAVEFSKIAVGPVDWDYHRYPFIFDSIILCSYSFILLIYLQVCEVVELC